MPEPKTASAKKRVFLVDDHPLIRERMAQLIEREPNWSVCGEAEEAPEALKSVLLMRPDIVIVDLSLKDSHGLELIKDLQQQCPDVPILVLSMHEESLYALRSLRAVAMGYITKLEGSKEVLAAIRKVMDGQVYLSGPMQERLMQSQFVRRKQSQDSIEQLTDRELEVFQLLGRGFATRRIARELGIGIKSVEVYRARIKEKLNISDGTELLFRAMQWAHGLR